MFIFISVISLFSFTYFYTKNFKTFGDFISYIFSNVLLYLGYEFGNIDFIEEYPSKLMIISSHTSIYDFLIGILYYYSVLHKKYNIYILMKDNFHKVCSPILSILDKKIKLISVDYNKKGLTKKICDELSDKDNYIIFIAPEGTRKCTDKLKTGYWNIAKNLDINISYIGIDFITKDIVLENYRKPFNKWEEEEDYFIKYCKKYIPLYPERCHWTKNFYSLDESS
jgi:1-acyl-sn-glycerol-3-phosphate acyltransferase